MSDPDDTSAADQFVERMRHQGRGSQRAALVLRLRMQYAKMAYISASAETDGKGETAESFAEIRDVLRDAIAYIRAEGRA